jgi:Family of unknown function (DUF5989)
MSSESATVFEQAAQDKPPGFVREVWDFVWHNKKWWLLPILLVLLLFGALMLLAGTGVAPFIYTLF